jgi:hypothetical protein
VFQQAGRSIEVGATELQSGDFDDNKQAEVLALGTKDILERAPTQVLFFSEDLERATVQPIPGLLGAPVVGRFTNSPYDGLAFGSLPGMAMLIGRRDRQFFPRSYPTFETPPGVTDARIYFVDFFANQGPVSGSPSPTDFPVLYSTLKGPQGELHELLIADQQTVVAQMPAGPSELQGDLVMGILNEQLPCPTAVAGYKNIDKLFVIPLCGQSFPVTPQALPLIPKMEPSSAPLLVDLDRDGHLDIFLWIQVPGSTDAAGSVPLASYGNGKGEFFSEPGGTGAPGFTLYAVPSSFVEEGDPCLFPLTPELLAQADPALREFLTGKALLPMPLATAKMDSDNYPDFVMPFGVCLSGAVGDGPPRYSLRGSVIGLFWEEAVIADFNADGLADVALAATGNQSLDLMLASPKGYFNTVNVPLNGSPSQLRLGDFDGDGSMDVAFRESGVQGTSNTGDALGDAVSVLFGTAKQIPSTLVRVGRFSEVEHLTSGSISLVFQDGISDLGVLTRGQEAQAQVALFRGSTDRAMRSPKVFQFEQGPQARLYFPLLFAAGRHAAKSEPQQDVSAIAFEGEASENSGPEEESESCEQACLNKRPCKNIKLHLWQGSVTGDGEIKQTSGSDRLQDKIADRDLVFQPGCTSKGQIAAGDLDGDGVDEILFVAPAKPEPTDSLGARLFVARTAEGKPTVTQNLLLEGLPPTERGRLQVTDVDGDGKQDVLLKVEKDGRSQLAVLWNQGDGRLEAAPTLVAPANGSAIEGFCAVQAASGRREVLALTQSGLLRMSGNRTPTLTPVVQRDAEAAGGIAMTCADLDGDGVDDVAISSGSLVRVFRGQTVRP